MEANNNPLKIALIGYGKMGKAIEAIALEQGHKIVLTIDHHNLADFTTDRLEQADVAIEFSNPADALHNIKRCVDAGLPVVSGTTGWLADWEEAADYCRKKNGALLYASNFSIGVNIFFEVNKKLAALMAVQPGYEVMIEEIHHTQKKDAPSGTAITLADQVIEASPLKKSWVNEATANENELTILSKREDPAPGTHVVQYRSPVDEITITHTAHSRQGFAVGALAAAVFIKGKKGIFGMKEVLGL